MIAFAHRVQTRARVWGHLMAAGCADNVTADELYAAVAARLPDDDSVLIRHLLSGCVAVCTEVNLQIYRKARPPEHTELARALDTLSPELTTPNDLKTSAALMHLWSDAYANGDPAALRRFVPVVHAGTRAVRRHTLATMMMMHMRSELDQLAPLGRQALAETFTAAPLRAAARAHILAAMWAEGFAAGDLRWQQTLIRRMSGLRQRTHADVLWICARGAAAGIMPGATIAETDYGCECPTGQEAARWLAGWINGIAKGIPGMQGFLRAQFGLHVARDPDMANHLLSVGVAWLTRRLWNQGISHK